MQHEKGKQEQHLSHSLTSDADDVANLLLIVLFLLNESFASRTSVCCSIFWIFSFEKTAAPLS